MNKVQNSPAAERATLLLKALTEAQTDISELLNQLTPADLEKVTVCSGWKVRDQIGHILDATELLLQSLEKSSTILFASSHRPADMAPAMFNNARKRSQNLTVEQARTDFAHVSQRLLKRLAAFNELGWESQIPHPYLGVCPAVQVAGFALLDWMIHPWDIREALGGQPVLRPDHAALLVPGLLNLLPLRLNVIEAGSHEGRFRFLIEKPDSSDKFALQLDVVLSSNTAYLERNVSEDVTPDVTFKGRAEDLALAMLGRRPLSQVVLPSSANDTWLPRWPDLWISL